MPEEAADYWNQATLTVEEAGQLLGVSRSSAYNAVKAGQLPVLRIGKRLIVPTAALRRLLDDARPGSATA